MLLTNHEIPLHIQTMIFFQVLLTSCIYNNIYKRIFFVVFKVSKNGKKLGKTKRQLKF